MSVVVSMNNADYAEMKAIELIHEARQCHSHSDRVGYHEKVTQAISLLALGRAQRYEPDSGER